MRVFWLIWLAGSLSAQSWTALNVFPGVARDDGVAVEVEGKAYVGTGLLNGWVLGRDFFVMHLGTHTWSNVAAMPVGTERQYASAFKGPSCFYVVGGDGTTGVLNTMYKYSLVSDAWTQMSSKPGAGVYGASLFEFGDTIILFGGRFQGGATSAEVWNYSISTDTWTQKNNMPAGIGGRWRASAAALQGKGYCLFGIDSAGIFSNDLLEYTPLNDSWAVLPTPASEESRAYASLQVINNQLVLFGGMDSLNQYYPTVHYFVPSSASWSQGPVLPASGRRGGMSWTNNNRFYYTCGLNLAQTRLNETWMLDIPLRNPEFSESTTCISGPNPFGDEIRIEGLNQGSRVMVKLVDGLGKSWCASEDRVNDDRGIRINTMGLSKGLYLLQVWQTGQAPVIKKMVKE